MSRDLIKNFITAFLVRGPFALSVFYISITQNKNFSSSEIILLGEILSFSVIFSILFLQPLGNIFNKTIPSLVDESLKSFANAGLIILVLFFPIFFILPALYFKHFIFFSISLAVAQASFQWALSYLTVKDIKQTLISVSLVMSGILFLIAHFFFEFEGLSLKHWLSAIIISYLIPSSIILLPLLNFKFLKDFKFLFIDHLKKFLSAASFYSILSLIFWLVEFYPRLADSFGNEFITNFNVYMTISIGLVGAVDIGLSQVFLKDYLQLVETNRVLFKSFFIRLIKFYFIVYTVIFLVLIIFKEYYWNWIFDNTRFNNFEMFGFLFIIEICRIMCFHSYNVFYYLNKIKDIQNSVILLCLSSFSILLMSFFEVVDGIQYLILFLILLCVILSYNLFKVNKIL